MAKYIDADKLALEPDEQGGANGVLIIERQNGKTMRLVLTALKNMIDSAPAEDVAPVVHGHWFLTEPEYLNCSVCGNSYYTGIETLSAALDHLEYAGGYKFCPNCGAKMDGGADNG